MGFDYNWTCPIIDESISDFKYGIESVLRPILEAQEIPEEKILEIINDSVDDIYAQYEYTFEDCRESNADMRDAADQQLDEKDREIADLQEACDEKDAWGSGLESEVDSLNERLDEMREWKDELQSELDSIKEKV